MRHTHVCAMGGALHLLVSAVDLDHLRDPSHLISLSKRRGRLDHARTRNRKCQCATLLALQNAIMAACGAAFLLFGCD